MGEPARGIPSTGPDLTGQQFGQYQILTQLAAGGMGGVYAARKVGVAGFERIVAIKLLHPHLANEEEFVRMFLDEARLAARIRHPNVVATVDVSDSERAGFFLVMEYIEGHHAGGLLREAAQRNRRLPGAIACRIVLDALAGLGAAHDLVDERGQRLNLVHRDISPHNILVGTDGIARLTDFGVAKAEVRLSSTRDGQFKGKLGYMAPEHASSGESDQRSDLFSMGIVLWECLTGRRLFRGENNAATLAKILNEPIPAPSSVSNELAPFDPLLKRALCRTPAKRFANADEFAVELERVAVGCGGVATAREVGDLVRSYAGTRLVEETDRVQKAIARLGPSHTSSAAAPAPSSAPAERPPAPLAESISSTTAKSPLPRIDPRRGYRAVGIAAVLLLAGVLGAWVVASTRPEPRTSTVRLTPNLDTPRPPEPPHAPERKVDSPTPAQVRPSPPPTDRPTSKQPSASSTSAARSDRALRIRRARLRALRARQRRQRRPTPTPPDHPSARERPPAAPEVPKREDDLLENPYRR